MTKYLLLMTVLIFSVCTTANADFYQWEDKNGDIHISDYPPPAKTGKKIKVYKSDSGSSAVTGDEENQDGSKKGKAKKESIILYTKNNCTECDKAREFLKGKNITFTEYNIENDREAAQKRKEIDGSDDVPLAIIDRDNIYGFSESVYSRVLKIKP